MQINHQPLISIIVPVYNAEKYLPRCIDSILAQTFSSFELILVDDGSNDESGKICDAYSARDTHISVIHQENAGVSAARNIGILAACGQYIGFVDADDWIDSNMYEKMLAEMQKNGSEIAMCDTVTAYADGRTVPDTITQLDNSCVLACKSISPNLLLELAGSACRCLYSSNLLNDNRIRFPVGIKLSEDRIFNLYAFGLADEICYLKEAYYHRYMETNSATHRFHADHFEICKSAAKATRNALIDVWKHAEYQHAYHRQFVSGALSSICNCYYKTSTLSLKERWQTVRDICHDNALRRAIDPDTTHVLEKWILKRRVLFLSIYAVAANLKHRR